MPSYPDLFQTHPFRNYFAGQGSDYLAQWHTEITDSEFKTGYSHVEWKYMAGMRYRLIHNDMGADYTLGLGYR